MRNTKLLIIFLVLAIIIVAGASFLFRDKGAPPTSVIQEIVPPSFPSELSPLPSPTPITTNRLTKEQLIALTPLDTSQFLIEYYSKRDTFRVTIKESPYAENKQLAEEWFKERGLEVDKLKIDWTAYKNVQ